jgi:carboxyl-terminal processing protease
MGKWRKLLWLGLAFLALNGVMGWKAGMLHAEGEEDNSYASIKLFTTVLELIRQDYVDQSKVSYKELIHAALKGMLSSLDPHSQFLDEEAFAEMQKETKGEFNGLGIMVGMKDGYLTVLTPIEETPSFRAGILPGDRILKIDDKSTDKMPLATAIKKLRGAKGEKVKLTLLRPASKGAREKGQEGQLMEVELARETIRVATVKESKMLPPELAGDEKIGYIRIEQFGENTALEFDKALSALEKSGMQALVLDLRNNPGGLLDAAVEVAGKFLPPGQMVVYTQGRTQQQHYEYAARSGKQHPNYPLVVLVNGYSASGAEIVAGALKDLRRAVLVGETTFGKGSVQSVQDLGGGIGLRLTTAKYYTPGRQVIHEVGVAPDIPAPISEKEERQLMQVRSMRYLSPEEQKELRNVRDTQLERAVGSLKGIRIYTQRQAALAVP